MKFKENEELSIPMSNPHKVKVTASFFKCEECGKELISSNETIRISKTISEMVDKFERGEIGEDDVVKIPKDKIFS